jgi:hypothetical protein
MVAEFLTVLLPVGLVIFVCMLTSCIVYVKIECDEDFTWKTAVGYVSLFTFTAAVLFTISHYNRWIMIHLS